MIRLLTGPEKVALRDALMEHYDPFSIKEFTEKRLNKQFFNYTTLYAVFQAQLLEFINQFTMKGWHGELIIAFLSDFPDHKTVQSLAFDLGISAQCYTESEQQLVDCGGLQNLLDSTPFLDVSVFLQQISKLERCICRVEITMKDDTEKWGTGVLVGPDRVMSNYHVFEDLITRPQSVKSAICRFDYNASADGTQIFPGYAIALHPDPKRQIIASSPYAELDVTGSPSLDTPWPIDKLDYALVRLEREIDREAYGPAYGGIPAPKTTESERGYIKVPAERPAFFNGSHLFIIQHPEKAPKKVAFGFGKVDGMDAAGQRVRYQVNTLKGSSGSPCFNEKFEWVALHNMGDPSWNPQYNQGVPVYRILEDLKKQNCSLPN